MSEEPPDVGVMDRVVPPASLLVIESMTVRYFRGLTECTLTLEPTLTLLVGRNSAGKSRLLRALALACGSVPAEADDFTVGPDSTPTIDLVLAPPVSASGEGDARDFDGRVRATFGPHVQPISVDGAERIAWRTRISHSLEGYGGRTETRFLTYDAGAQAWTASATADLVSRDQRGMLAADLVGTGRDLAAELTRPGSAIRRVLSDLDVADDQRGDLEAALQALGARIVESSRSLAAIHAQLTDLQHAVADIGHPEMSPLPTRLEELARMIEITLSNSNSGGLPMRLHGSGARSLASLQVQSVLYNRRLGRDGSDLPTHPLSLIEEPEAHLHPQACFDLRGLLQRIPGQVVVSTHSSHLVTVAPLVSVRLVRQDDGETVVRDLHPIDDEVTTPAAMRVGFSSVEWEKLKRLVERPFGELLFANAVVVGDGASERGFLPHLLRHALGPAAAGVCVVDPMGMSQADPLVKFAAAVGIPCVLFCDADPAGKRDSSKLPPSAIRVWATGDSAERGDLEDVLCQNNEQWCLEQCERLMPSVVGTAHERLDELKGTYGHPLGRAFVEHFSDVDAWPQGFQDLVNELRPAVKPLDGDDA